MALPFTDTAMCLPGCSTDLLCKCPADLDGLSAIPRTQRGHNRVTDAPPAKSSASSAQRPRIRSNALQAKAGSACLQVHHGLFPGKPAWSSSETVGACHYRATTPPLASVLYCLLQCPHGVRGRFIGHMSPLARDHIRSWRPRPAMPLCAAC